MDKNVLSAIVTKTSTQKLCVFFHRQYENSFNLKRENVSVNIIMKAVSDCDHYFILLTYIWV